MWWSDAWWRGRRKSPPQIIKKLVDSLSKNRYFFPAMFEEKEICIYCNFEVELLEVVHTAKGNRALIRFEDGREDEVPLGSLEFV